ncbi:MAG TPA: NAD-dependent epimerase/dehydratase family protein [Bacteroidales bacterium]|nr:NAD-dependent epimerase/dehydratase family protein [Bacteroidales bacterium]
MEKKGLRVIITGSTGMVGEGVLLVCLQNPAVEKVLTVSRRPSGINHPKLTEIIHENFHDLSAVESQLSGYDACFFCLGVSSVGMKSDEYYKVTYELTMHFGETVSRLNNDMVFCYVSGAGTDSSEKGRIKWARVKGKTENDLMKLPFRKVYGYRPGFMKPVAGQTKTLPYYKYVNWLFPVGKKLYPEGFNTLEEVGLSMISLAGRDYDKNILRGKDISALAAAQKAKEQQ